MSEAKNIFKAYVNFVHTQRGAGLWAPAVLGTDLDALDMEIQTVSDPAHHL